MKLKDIIGSMASKFVALALALVCADSAWAADPVAKIGTTEYTTLAAAIAAVPTTGAETTITMIADSAEPAVITVASGKNVVLDLNGKTVSYTTDAKSVYFLTNKGTLTIQDTSTNADGQVLLTAQPDTGYSVECVTVYNLGGTLTLESGTIKNATGGGLAYAVNNSSNAWGAGDDKVSTFNMTGGKVSAPGGDAALRVYQNCAAHVAPVSKNYVNISGGTIVDTGIFVDTVLYTDSGIQEGFADSIDTEINISGGTVNGLIDLKIRHKNNTKLNITGGDFTNAKLWVRKKADEYKGDEPTEPMVSISGGQFAFVAGKAFGLSYDCGATSWTSYAKPYAVSGGVFNVEVPAFACAEGYEPAANTDPETSAAYQFTVGKLPVAQIVETDVTYFTLAAAIAAAQSGDTVTLLADTAVADTITINKSMTLDLNGKTITNTSTGKRPFYVVTEDTSSVVETADEDGNVVFEGATTLTVEGNGGSLVIPDGGTAYGFFDIAKPYTGIVINGGTISGDGGNGSLIRYGVDGGYAQQIALNNVTGITKSRMVSYATAYYLWDIKVIGGTYTHNNYRNDNGGYLKNAFQFFTQNGIFDGVTITSDEGSCVCCGGSYQKNMVFRNNTFTVKEKSIISDPWNNAVIAVQTAGSLTIESGTYTSAGIYGVATANSGATINIEGGTITGADYGVRIYGGGYDPDTTLNISGTANVTGGQAGVYVLEIGNGNGTATANINGGTIAGGITIDNKTATPSRATVEIEDGEVSGTLTDASPSGKSGVYSVSGGVFSSQVRAEYCTADYSPITNTDPKTNAAYPYTVASDYDAQIVRGGVVVTPKGSLAAMIAAAQDGDTVQLLTDCETGTAYTHATPLVFNTANATLDLNGKTLTITYNMSLVFRCNSGVVMNGTIVPGVTDSNVSGDWCRYGLTIDSCTGVTVSNVVSTTGIAVGGDPDGGYTPGAGPATDVVFTGCTVTGRTTRYAVMAQNQSTATIKDGTYNAYAANGNVLYSGFKPNDGGAGSLTVTGGSFMGAIPDSNIGAIVISGGIFSKQPVAGLLAQGCMVVANEDAATKNAYPWTVGVAVAQIGATKYETLAEAVAAVPADGTKTTITMIANEAIDIAGNALVIAASKNVVLDLNGFQVVGFCSTGENSALILNNGTLTIVDSSDENADGTGAGKLAYSASPSWNWSGVDGDYSGSYASNLILNNGTVSVESGLLEVINPAGTIISASFAIDSAPGRVVNINGGKLTSACCTVIRVRVDNSTQSALNIAGGSVVAVSPATRAIWVQDSNYNGNSTVNISGGLVSGPETSIQNDSYGSNAKTIITGGTFNGFFFTYSELDISDGTFNGGNRNGYVYSVSAYGKMSHISGGVFHGYADFYSTASSLDWSVTGGAFSNGGPLQYASTSEAFVRGGIYDVFNKQGYIAPGFVLTNNTDPATKGAYPYAVVPAATVTFSKGEEADVTDFVCEPMAYPSGNPAEIALPQPTYTAEGKTFAGWKVNGEGDAISAIPAGTTGDIALTATWISATTVDVVAVEAGEETEEKEAPIKVTQEWIDANVTPAGSEATAKEIKDALNETAENGLKKWENYVLGVSPTAAVTADVKQGEVTATPVTSNVKVPAYDTGFKVQYRLDKVDASGGNATVAVAKQDSDVLPLDLSKMTEAVAYYKTTAVITANNDADVSVEVKSENTVGVMKVANAPKTAIVGVPWEALDSTGAIAVADLVRTATLSEGDELYAYDSEAKKYKSWTLENGEWKSMTTATESSTEEADKASTVKLARGKAVWLKRSDASKPIYLVGEVATGDASTTLETGTVTEPRWNLVASPLAKKVSIADVIGESTTDKIIVPTAGAPKNIRRGSDGKYYYDTTEPVMDGDVQVGVVSVTKEVTELDAGTGFWFLNSGTKEKIDWSSSAE